MTQAQSYTDDARIKRALDRAEMLDKLIGLRGKRVLEVGCGHGDFAQIAAERFDCDVVGMEIMHHEHWESLRSVPNLRLVSGDISSFNSEFADSSFDRIISFVVWEHIRHPWSALKECQRLLKIDGKKYLHAYMYGWPRLSHLYSEINAPWLHLLQSPQEIMDELNKKELPWYYWCNRLSYQHYLFYFRQLGFFVTHENIIRDQFDEAFYKENEQLLGLYPKFDLTAHGLQVVLEFDEAFPKRAIADPVFRLKK